MDTNAQDTASNLTQAQIEDIDSMLEHLGIEDQIEVTGEEKASEDVIEGVDTISIEDVEASTALQAVDEDLEIPVDENALDVELAKAEAYAEHESSTSIEEAPKKAPSERKNAKKAKATKPPSVPRVRSVADLDAGAFVLTTDEPADLEANKLAVLATRPTQKKIAEKFDNVLISAAAGKAPSTFVVDCFKILDTKKEVSSSELVAALLLDGYSDGTARSQAGQIMALFDVLKIADRSAMKLTLRKDSTLAELYRSA